LKREARLLLQKACDALLLAVVHFNCPHDTGRTTAVLILLDHSFEMLLKAAIVHRGGALRDSAGENTIGFAKCVRRAVSEGGIQFLSDEQAIALQITNGLRDAAQHHLLQLCEEQLYMQAQAGVTLFGDVLQSVFGRTLCDCMPRRVLPVSTVAPGEIVTLFDRQVAEIRKLLAPNRRRTTEADALLMPMAIMDNAILGDTLQPAPRDIARLRKQLRGGADWSKLFPGVAAIRYDAAADGIGIALRLTKRDGIPTHLVPETAPNAAVVAVKRVNELDYYCFGRDQVAERILQSRSMTTALIWHARLKGDPDCHRQIRIGRSVFDR
jgi:hypothetical protein